MENASRRKARFDASGALAETANYHRTWMAPVVAVYWGRLLRYPRAKPCQKQPADD
jgi:hypothetical protein